MRGDVGLGFHIANFTIMNAMQVQPAQVRAGRKCQNGNDLVEIQPSY
jgi:hypothetical protein